MSDEEPRWTVEGETREALVFVIVILGIVLLWESDLLAAMVTLAGG